jgi:hypothetical protein
VLPPWVLSGWQDAMLPRTHSSGGVIDASLSSSRFCVKSGARACAEGENEVELGCGRVDKSCFWILKRKLLAFKKDRNGKIRSFADARYSLLSQDLRCSPLVHAYALLDLLALCTSAFYSLNLHSRST